MGIISSLTSSFYGTITIPQAAPAAILSLIATAIAGSISAAGSSETVFTTVVIAIAFTSLLTGTFLLLLGRFKLGNLIRFIPYPVVGGFLAGTGWLLVRGAIGIMTDITPGIAQFPHFFQPDVLVKWLPGLIFAILLFFILRHYHQFWILPVMILGAIILFYIVVFLSQASLAEVSTSGWLLAHFPEGTLWKPPPPAALSNVDWWIILSQIGNMGTIIIISVITLLLSASGLELIIQEEINLNRELQSTGIANMAAGLGASPVGYMSLALSALGFRIGANRRAAGIIAAGLCGITLVFGATIFSYFPKPLLGGLLIFLGLSFLFEWVYETWFKLPKAEYLLLLSILIIIGVFGFLEGVSVGLLIAVILFVVNYSRIDVVKHALSGANYQSNVDRAAPYQRLLRKKGDQLYILKLQGFIFFGTANNLLDQVRQRLNNSSLPALNYLILDFRFVN
ncbi:MAG: cyclic nucleotide-binding protein, partial [Gammaproteobacteria bacterium]|nr:cyclic nucleotide-binding protein [Gammaproteobacteria bacterium]